MSLDTQTPSSLPPVIPSTRAAPPPPRLGEELPVFCEKCGYALHGLPPVRCGQCSVLHLACPECGHHQPVNTLRPAFQRLLGRVRAALLVIVVFFKFNFFAWALIGAGAMAFDWAYMYDYQRVTTNGSAVARGSVRSTYHQPRPLDDEAAWIFALAAAGFGFLGRLMLLRWRRGLYVAVALAGLACLALLVGAYCRKVDVGYPGGLLSADLLTLCGLVFLGVVVGALIAWPVWYVLVRAFLSATTATALLDWQRTQSLRADALARQ